jgi:hypothetical protein
MANCRSRVVDIDVINDHSDSYRDGWAMPIEQLSKNIRALKPPQALTNIAVGASHCSLLTSGGGVGAVLNTMFLGQANFCPRAGLQFW